MHHPNLFVNQNMGLKLLPQYSFLGMADANSVSCFRNSQKFGELWIKFK